MTPKRIDEAAQKVFGLFIFGAVGIWVGIIIVLSSAFGVVGFGTGVCLMGCFIVRCALKRAKSLVKSEDAA